MQGLAMQGAGLGKVLTLEFGEGFLGSAASQKILNEDGEIDWEPAIGEGMFSALMTWGYGGNGERRVKERSERVKTVIQDMLQKIKLEEKLEVYSASAGAVFYGAYLDQSEIVYKWGRG